MGKAPKKVYERVYIHAAKAMTEDGWALVLFAMDGCSEYAFEPVSDKDPVITAEVLDKLFKNILKEYKPIFHPRQIVFVTSLSIECDHLLKQAVPRPHRLVYNKEATLKAMGELLGNMSFEVVDL